VTFLLRKLSSLIIVKVVYKIQWVLYCVIPLFLDTKERTFSKDVSRTSTN